MADTATSDAVKASFGRIEVPGGGTLADYSGLSEIIVTPSAVAVAISVAPGMESAFAPVRTAAEQAASEASGGRKVMISLTADKGPGGAGGSPGGQRQPEMTQQPVSRQTPVEGIKHIIAVASGKGGVGKSTCAVNLALALHKEGLKVGLLDADLYGPSIPKLLGLEGKPALREDGLFIPFETFGIKAISIGSMLTGDQAVVWRGPMATSALRQLLRETGWGELDVLIVDLPPGTGDIQISLCQQVELAGAVIVSTPQDLALIDAKKAIDMFGRLQIPILGLIENMSFFIAPDTGNRYDIFGHGGAEMAAGQLGIPFLGGIPLVMSIREGSDSGAPVLAVSPDGEDAAAFRQAAASLLNAQPSLRS